MYWVYILRCADGTLYTGISTDTDRRVREHNRGVGAKYTRSRRPVELLYREQVPDKPAALRRELWIKGLSRGDKLKLMGIAEG